MDLASKSSPTVAAAHELGISTDYAFLITDSVLAANDGFGIRTPAWPFGHFWHGWAVGEASRMHGSAAVGTFARTIHDFYYEKAHGRLAPHGVGA
jgi:hypothetical protein